MRTSCLISLAASLLCADAARAEPNSTPITFQLNDAATKDEVLPGVHLSVARSTDEPAFLEGDTDDAGRLVLELAPGRYLVSYHLAGYVPIDRSPIEVGTAPEIITTTLSMMLEATGDSNSRRIRIILNWGSNPNQVRDADSHLVCPLDDPPVNISFQAKEHEAHGQSIRLDVDDTDWGGPETITLIDPRPGTYSYWVHRYSEPLATLGAADVVVRVLLDDAMVGEFRPPVDYNDPTWRPFEAIVVDEGGAARIAEFTPEQQAASAATLPPGAETPYQGAYELDPVPPDQDLGDPFEEESCNAGPILAILMVLLFAGFLILRKRR